MDTFADEEVKKQGRKRVRTKGLQKKLQQQIEFYFGDANLQKDRFLQQKMREHPEGYISVETIASFNKMKALTSNLSMVVQVMKRSELVELSADEKWVRRSTPLPTATDADNRTVYVEHIPPNSTHDSIRKLFKVFGSITYVSLPRHKSSSAIKGFCFIEFATAEEAEAVLEYFQSGTKPVTPSSKSFPDKSATVTEVHVSMARGEGSGGEKGKGNGKEEGEGDGKEGEGDGKEEGEGDGKEVEGDGKEKGEGDGKEEREEVVAQSRKRRRNEGTTEDDHSTDTKESDRITPAAKKPRPEDAIPQEVGEGSSGGAAETPAETPDVKASEETLEKEGEVEEVSVRSKKRKRDEEGGGGGGGEGRKKGEIPAAKTSRLDAHSSATGDTEKQTKSGDSAVRLTRLDSQSSETGGEEGEREREREPKKGKKKNRQHKKRDWEAALKAMQLRVMAKKEWLEMRGIFRNLQKEKVREMKQQLQETGGGGEAEGGRVEKGFVARCLVKVEGVGSGEGEDMVTIEKVQAVCSKYGSVAYTDIKEGDSEGYVRYASSGCVENLVNAETHTHIKFTPVSEEDERAYYLQTVASRKQLAKSQWRKKKRNVRGQDKIISKALQNPSHKVPVKSEDAPAVASHIRFSDSEHES